MLERREGLYRELLSITDPIGSVRPRSQLHTKYIRISDGIHICTGFPEICRAAIGNKMGSEGPKGAGVLESIVWMMKVGRQ
jgi:hypothetical protein